MMGNSLTNYNKFYSVDIHGNIYNTIAEKLAKPYKTKSGYLQVRISKLGLFKNFYIHRLIAEEFIPNPLALRCVNHKDGNKLNNSINNLEWCTHSENNQHAYDKLGKIGAMTGKFSKDCPNSKPIMQCDIKGNVIKTYYSTTDATINTNFIASCISRCLNGKLKTHRKFIWKFMGEKNG